MPSPPIRLVIFDMDDVLAHLDRKIRLQYLADITRLDPGFLQSAIWDSDFERSAVRGAYPTGAEYLAEFSRRIGFDLARQDWVEARRRAMTLNRPALEIAARLKQTTPIAMLTNNGSLLKESLPELAPEICAVFGDRAHASFEFGARKPEAAVFERILASYSVSPPNALFIDDTAEFVAGARAVGLRPVHYTNIDALKEQLASTGISLI
jgi:glucose-1-phosphatase